MKTLRTNTFWSETDLTMFVNSNGILQQNIISINAVVKPDTGQGVFIIFYYDEK